MVKRRNTRSVTKTFDQNDTHNEILRLERKKTIYKRKEAALKKMLELVEDQILKVEIEGLQLGDNLRQKVKEEADDVSGNLKEEEAPEIKTWDVCKNEIKEEISEEINKTELNLGNCLEDFYNASYGATEEIEDDDEDDDLQILYSKC